MSKYHTTIKCPECLSRNNYYSKEIYERCLEIKQDYLFKRPEIIKCRYCGVLLLLTKKYIVKNENKTKTKMKLGEVKEEEIRTTTTLPEHITFSKVDIDKADFNLKELESKEGEKYKRWIMVLEDGTEYSIPNCVMQGFKKMTEKKAKELEIEKTGTGLNTKYELSYTK